MSRRMPVVIYPVSVRQNCLKAYADEVPLRQISKLYGPSGATIFNWALDLNIVRGSKCSEEEIAQKLETKGEQIRQMIEQNEQREDSKKKKSIQSTRANDTRYGRKKVETGMKAVDNYKRMVADCMGFVAENMKRATSLEEKAKAAMLGTLFAQIQMTLDSPLNPVTVADQERIFNQVQKLLGMNDAKAATKRIDINILNSKVVKPSPVKTKGRVLDASLVEAVCENAVAGNLGDSDEEDDDDYEDDGEWEDDDDEPIMTPEDIESFEV